MSEKLNSHIVVPKCVLRQFVDDKYFLYQYDKNKVRHPREPLISHGHPDTVNTEYGYYSKEVEHILSNNIESPIGKVIRFINENHFKEPSFAFSTEYQQTIREYIWALLSRSQNMLTSIKGNSIYFQFMTKQNQHDYAVTSGLIFSQEKNLFSEYGITFLVNKTSNPFILPLCGVFSYCQNEKRMIFVPLSPYLSVVLVDASWIQENTNNGITKMMCVLNPTVLDSINQYACIYEMQNGVGIVVSNNRCYLNDIVKSYLNGVK